MSAERPLRVLHLNTERGWRGGENQVYLLQRGLRELGDEVLACTVCREGEALAQRLQSEALATLPVPVHGSIDPAVIRRATRFVQRHGVDLLHAHTSHGHSLGLVVARLTGRPLVVTRRVDFAVRGGLKYGPAVARFVAISRGVARVLEAAGVAPARIRLIHSGIDPARFAVEPIDLRSHFDLPPGPVGICVAALVAHKGHEHLLQAWRQVAACHPDASLLLVGGGAREAELGSLAGDLPQVRFLGWRDDVPILLRSADFFTMTSVEEGLGTSIMDAMCCGLPVVVTAAGGIPELVDDGVEGRLLPVGDSDGLAAALTSMVTDPAARRAWAQGAQRRAEGFHYHRMVRSYRDLYREVCR